MVESIFARLNFIRKGRIIRVDFISPKWLKISFILFGRDLYEK